MFFSVVVCVHNNASIITETLEAIRKNTFKDYELIVVDDGSTDNTGEVAKPMCDTLITIDKPHGPAYARNLGVSNAGAEWVVFIDSDAVIPDNQLRLFYEAINSKSCIGVSTGTSLDGIERGFYARYCAFQEEFYLREYTESINNACFAFITTRCGAIKKEVFSKVDGFDDSFKVPSIEDFEFSLRVLNMDLGYFVYLDNSAVRHYWANSLYKIFQRLYRNSFLFSRYIRQENIPEGMLTTRSRVFANLLSLSAVFCLLCSALYPPALLLCLMLLLPVIWLHRAFLAFLKPNGAMFQLKTFLLLNILPLPVMAGFLSGKLPGRRHNAWHS